MNPLNQFFGEIYLISLNRRQDRRNHAKRQFELLENPSWELFEAYDAKGFPDDDGLDDGNRGCTESHGAVLSIIAHRRLPWSLVLEDDFECRFPNVLERFEAIAKDWPFDGHIVYLGGSYAEPPKHRESRHFIRTNAMMTTSSYAIRWDAARKMAPHIHGHGPVDSLFAPWCRTLKAYCIQPRLFVQTESFSDLQQRVMSNRTSLEDRAHEDSLPGGPPHEAVGSHAKDWQRRLKENIERASREAGVTVPVNEHTRGFPTVGGVPVKQ